MEQPCPPVRILDAAKDLTRFRDEIGRDPTDMAYQLRMSDIESSCRYDEATGGLVVELAFALLVEPGPAAHAGASSFDYFVALTDRARNILAKEIFAARLGFEVEKKAVSAVVRARADFTIGPGARASDYTVYVGFQLDPRDLESQRRR